ncbi:hypothetical protein GCM10027575_58130 [Phytohabitans suffuscus]
MPTTTGPARSSSRTNMTGALARAATCIETEAAGSTPGTTSPYPPRTTSAARDASRTSTGIGAPSTTLAETTRPGSTVRAYAAADSTRSSDRSPSSPSADGNNGQT